LTAHVGAAYFETPEEIVSFEVVLPGEKVVSDETARGVAGAFLSRGMI
jgi:hypothetical protein